MAVKKDKQVVARQQRAKEILLDSIRDFGVEHNFKIRDFQNNWKEMGISSYLIKVYYMGTFKNNGDIIPITCSMEHIQKLQVEIEKWVEQHVSRV